MSNQFVEDSIPTKHDKTNDNFCIFASGYDSNFEDGFEIGAKDDRGYFEIIETSDSSNMEENSSMLNENDFNQDMFEEMADRIDSEVLDEVGEGDDAQIGRVTSERIEMELEEKYPNRKISVTYSPYNTGRNYSAFDQNEEEIIADYTV